jgi:hypothetical protein
MAYLTIFAMPAADRWRGEKTFAEDIRRRWAQRPPVWCCTKQWVRSLPRSPATAASYDDAGKLRHDAPDNKLHWVIVRGATERPLNQLSGAASRQ